jgi:hypothetical protein
LINDGLNQGCQNNGQVTWTYNQGVILGGLVDLYKCTGDQGVLVQAQAIADAAITKLAPNGVLREPCEPDCGADGPQFKGIFVRNLVYLYRTVNKPTYREFILRNADSIWSACRKAANQFGLCWAETFDQADAARQSAAVDALNAAIVASRKSVTLQAEDAILHNLIQETTYQGYQGTGYVAGWNQDSQWIDFVASLPAIGRYDLVFRYAAAGGTASRYIYVNGKSVVEHQLFPGTQNWTNWSILTVPNVPLNAGKNTISVIFNRSKGSQNWLNLDQLTIR